jgi:hypothetical protein
VIACAQKCCSAASCQECCDDSDCAGQPGTFCSGGQCVTGCPNGQVLCGASCVTLSSDPNNCGGCGNQCLLGRTCASSSCTPAWVTLTTASAPAPRSLAASARAGSTVFVFGGQSGSTYLNDAFLYDPTVNQWTGLPASGLSGRVLSGAVSTGNHVVVWGGGASADVKDGARYNLGTGVWDSMNTVASQTPGARRNPVAFWTGSRVVIWGGELVSGAAAQGGGIYDDTMDTWAAMASNGQPTARTRYAWAWSGVDLIVFGGEKSNMATAQTYAWNAASNQWRSLANLGTPPSARFDAFGAWTTSGFFVAGGTDDTGASFDDAYLLDPVSETWVQVTPPAGASRATTGGREGWSAWTGLKVLLVQGYDPGGSSLSSLSVYQPNNDTWTMPASPTAGHRGGVGVWTGSEMVLWSGYDGTSLTTVGERYKP